MCPVHYGFPLLALPLLQPLHVLLWFTLIQFIFCYLYPFKLLVCWESCWAVEALKVFDSLLYILTCKLFDSSHLKTQRFNQDVTFNNEDVYFRMKRHQCPLSFWLLLTLILQSQFVIRPPIVEKQEQIGWQLQKGVIKQWSLMSLAPLQCSPSHLWMKE